MNRSPLPRLMLVTDGQGDPARILRVAVAAHEGGIRALQVRERRLTDRDFLGLLRRLRQVFEPGKALLLVNDRADLCLASGSDGVQLGFRSGSVGEVRALLGSRRWIGCSFHRPEEGVAAREAGADFGIFGPVFPTPSKRGILRPAGLRGLRRAVQAAAMPVFAIGGIDAARAAAVSASGCYGIAFIRSLFESRTPREDARELRKQAVIP